MWQGSAAPGMYPFFRCKISYIVGVALFCHTVKLGTPIGNNKYMRKRVSPTWRNIPANMTNTASFIFGSSLGIQNLSYICPKLDNLLTGKIWNMVNIYIWLKMVVLIKGKALIPTSYHVKRPPILYIKKKSL